MRVSGRPLVLLGFVVASAVACGDDSAAGGNCIEVREPLDPLSIQHVVDPDQVTFLTDPPTSGPHVAGPAATGLHDEPLSGAAQVRALEAGGAVVLYDDEADRETLISLLDDTTVPVAIAPGIDLPAPVVATAWTWKLTCDSPDLDAIMSFVVARSDDAPGED